MGCGTCPKKQLKLKSDLQGITRALLTEMQGYINYPVAVRDRIGQVTAGTCVDVWVDETETGELIESGSIAVETNTGIAMIGLNNVESIELLASHQ